MHLHPTIAGLIIDIGRDYGMRAVRLPSEPVRVLRRAFPKERYSVPFYSPWIEILRRRLRRVGLVANDNIFGLAWSGSMVEQRLLRLLPFLPAGVSELYLHPATSTSPTLATTMPGYRQQEEFAALLSPAVKDLVARLGIRLVRYRDLSRAPIDS